MPPTVTEPKDSAEVEVSPFRLHINFSHFRLLQFSARDIQFCRLDGEMLASHHLNAANIVSSELIDFRAMNTNWNRTDIKDCAFRSSEIRDSDLTFTSWINNIFMDMSFIHSTLVDTVMTDCIFIRAKFEHCDLSHLIIKRCAFVDCVFRNCTTSNKLIEDSVLRHTNLERVDIEVATILENFGLSAARCTGSAVYSDRPSRVLADLESLQQTRQDASLLPIQQLKLAYFMTGALPLELLDQALDISSWLPLCRVPSSFALILDGLATFLLGEFEDETMIAAPLLRLYLTARALPGTLEETVDSTLQGEFETAISASSLKLLPLFEQHLEMVQQLAEILFPSVTFVAEGPLEPAYFDSALRELLGQGASFRVERLVPKNSPSLLTLVFEQRTTLATLVSVFLASRVRFELRKMKSETSSAGLTSKRRAKDLDLLGHRDDGLIAFDIGVDPGERLAYHIRAYALFPQGISAVLSLDIGLGLISKARSVLLELLRHEKATDDVHAR